MLFEINVVVTILKHDRNMQIPTLPKADNLVDFVIDLGLVQPAGVTFFKQNIINSIIF